MDVVYDSILPPTTVFINLVIFKCLCKSVVQILGHHLISVVVKTRASVTGRLWVRIPKSKGKTNAFLKIPNQ